jgi:hypothetical protein
MKVLKVKDWKELTRNRKEWKKLVEKAKTLSGCSAEEEEEETRRFIRQLLIVKAGFESQSFSFPFQYHSAIAQHPFIIVR